MTLRNSWFALSLLVTLGACSSGTPVQTEPTAAPTALQTAEPSAAAAAEAPVAPSAAPLTVMSAVRGDALMAGWLDVKSLRDRGWLQLLDGLPPELNDRVRELEKKCGMAPWKGVDELAWSAGEDDTFVLVAKLGAPADAVMKCIEALSDGKAKRAAIGREIGLDLGGVTIVTRGDHLVAGRGDMLASLLEGAPGGTPAILSKLPQGADQIVRVAFDARSLRGTPLEGGTLAVTSGASRLAIELGLAAKDEATATQMETKAKSLQAELGQDAPKLPAIAVTRSGARLAVSVSKDGDLKQQAELIGTLAAVATFGVRRYVTSAKTAEAKNMVGAISRSIVAYSEREELDAKGKLLPHRCPPSAPPVPKDVPKGTKYMSAESEWGGAWKDMRMVMTWPQYYRYRVETAPNRKKCTVIAEGDLDGDGKLSKFTQVIEIDEKKGAKVSPDLTITNEFE